MGQNPDGLPNLDHWRCRILSRQFLWCPTFHGTASRVDSSFSVLYIAIVPLVQHAVRQFDVRTCSHVATILPLLFVSLSIVMHIQYNLVFSSKRNESRSVDGQLNPLMRYKTLTRRSFSFFVRVSRHSYKRKYLDFRLTGATVDLASRGDASGAS